MAISETIELGGAFAQRAFENDRKACETDDTRLYEKAVTDYTRAVEMFSLASTDEHNSIAKQLLRDKIIKCRDRKAILQDFLTMALQLDSTLGSSSRVSQLKCLNAESDSDDEEDLQNLFTRLELSTIDNDSLPSLNDVAGLDSAKQVLQEAIMLPEQFPDLFKTRRRWRTIMLYGPPGVGKTYVSKAITGESKSSFCALTAWDLMAAADENCERVVKELFASSRQAGKVVLYFDDVDFLFSTEYALKTERLMRAKAQVLKELQALQDSSHDVVFIATSQTPWLLEEAFLARMDRRVYAGLPDAKCRTKMLEDMLRNVSHTLTLEDIENIATECETYSGADMKLLVRDAEMEPLRIIQHSTHFRTVSVKNDGKRVRLMSPCSHDDDGAVEMRVTDIQISELHVPPVTSLDFELALDRTKPSVGPATIEKHLEFTRSKGQNGC